MSGAGTNMAALLYAARAADCPYEVVLVASNNPDAAGLKLAEAEGDVDPFGDEIDLSAVGPVRWVLPRAPVQPVTINGGYINYRISAIKAAGFDKVPTDQGTRILATLDEASYRPAAEQRMGTVHPIVWTRCVAQGRSVFSALGHQAQSYAEPLHRRLIGNAIDWAAGKRC